MKARNTDTRRYVLWIVFTTIVLGVALGWWIQGFVIGSCTGIAGLLIADRRRRR